MGINELQRQIISFICEYVRENKTPIAQREIVSKLSTNYPDTTIKASVRVLVRKGYLRKAVTISNSASYVLLRSL